MAMQPRELTQWAKEEVADGLTAWFKERRQDFDINQANLDDELALKKQVSRILKFLGQQREGY